MTVSKGVEKVDIRIETHTVPTKQGGKGVTPQRHLNVDYYKNNKRKTNDHKILDNEQ